MDSVKKTPHFDPMTFSELILGFSSAALYSMGFALAGEEPKNESAKRNLNAPLALQNIQIIELLKEKTTGNLTSDESRLIQEIINDLNAKYKSRF